MNNMWDSLIENFSDSRYCHTLKEIEQQPKVWQKTLQIVESRQAQIKSFLKDSLSNDKEAILVSGAGSSEFVGRAVLSILRKNFGRYVINAPSTDIVSHPQKYCEPFTPALMISFARSGNSPESLASVELIKKVSPATKHLIITCNHQGKLALRAKNDPNMLALLLPEESNDLSLVMTSSYSSMVLSAILCSYDNLDQFNTFFSSAFTNIDKIYKSYANQLAKLITHHNIDRVAYLASDDGIGILTEGHLKMLEMTDGTVATRVDSFLGLRHGPQVFIQSNTLVVALLSNDKYVRSYEIDLLKELKAKKQGYGYVVIGQNPNEIELPNLIAIGSEGMDDLYKLLLATVVVQLLGLFKSLSLNFSPDAPSKSGTINRVVEGVNIYPFK